jgi:hypothetical protein
MPLQHYSIVGFASALIIALTSEASFAFSIIPASPGATSEGGWRPRSVYAIENLEGITEVDTRLWTDPLPLGATNEFYQSLNLWSLTSELGFFGWNFKPAQQDLKGSFEIVAYQACGFQEACGGLTPIMPINRRGIGSAFYLKYNPSLSDPQPEQSKLFWIQRVKTTDKFFPFIDNRGRRSSPYYGVDGQAGENYFTDRPYRYGDRLAKRSIIWNAQLHLVQETTPASSRKREVTIYNGIRWGWRNTVRRVCPPEIQGCTTPPPPPPPPCNPSSGGGGCNLRTATVSQDEYQKVLLFDTDNTNFLEDESTLLLDNYDDSKSSTSIPESTSALGLLALGAWGIVKALKIRFNK